jgi:hypothetical protein
MVEEAADEMAASVKASLMDAQHDHAHTLETERRLRACLDRIEGRVRENVFSVFGMTRGDILLMVREERAEVEGKPAGEPQDAEPAQCRCREHWIGAQGEVCSRGAFPLASYLCLHCGRCRACHAQPAEGGK